MNKLRFQNWELIHLFPGLTFRSKHRCEQVFREIRLPVAFAQIDVAMAGLRETETERFHGGSDWPFNSEALLTYFSVQRDGTLVASKKHVHSSVLLHNFQLAVKLSIPRMQDHQSLGKKAQPKFSSQKPDQFWEVPMRNINFTGRKPLLDELFTNFKPYDTQEQMGSQK